MGRVVRSRRPDDTPPTASRRVGYALVAALSLSLLYVSYHQGYRQGAHGQVRARRAQRSPRAEALAATARTTETPSAPPWDPCGGVMRMAADVVFRGEDVDTVVAHSAGSCLRACEQRAGCAAFSFVRAAVARRGQRRRCSLKRRGPTGALAPAYFAGAVSGLPASASPRGEGCALRAAAANRTECPPGRGGDGCRFWRGTVRLYEGHDPYAGLALRPRNMDGWNVDEAVYAHFSAGASLIVEVGVWRGASAAHLARTLRRQGGGVLYAVDTWLGSIQFLTLSFTGGRPDPSRDLNLSNGYRSTT